MIAASDIDVAHELFVEDVYHAETIFDDGDRWLDVGCHAGYFSLLALIHGTKVVGGVDVDTRRVNEFQYAPALLCNLSTNDDLRTLIETTNANAVKLDIQGAESFLLAHNPDVNKLVVEWHYPEIIMSLLGCLESYSFKIIFCDAAIDILTREETYIVYARRVDA